MLAQNDPEGGAEKPPADEPEKPPSKLVRVLTVLVYLSSVSMAAILLSIYYLCIWKSPVLSDLELENEQDQANVEASRLQGETYEYQMGLIHNGSVPYNFTGGSSSTINDNDIQLPTASVPYPDITSEAVDTTSTEPTIQFNSTSFNVTTEDITTTNEDSSTIASTKLI